MMKLSDWFRDFVQCVNDCADTDAVMVPDDFDEKMAERVQRVLKAEEEGDVDVEMPYEDTT